MRCLCRVLGSSLVFCLACTGDLATPSLATSTADDDTGDAGHGPDSQAGTPTSGSVTTGDTGSETSTGEDTAASSSSSSSGTTTPSGVCGDGVVDPGEGCDAGFANNSDLGACTQHCAEALCGDGLLWLGVEQCDAGAANNDATYNGCREDCTRGPRCDDGVLQVEEECDASAPPVEGLAECDADTCRFVARLAFVTAATYTGELGGLAGADALCVAAAGAAGLDHASSFLAWLSDGVQGPSERFKDGAADEAYPYARRDGFLLASSFSILTSYGPWVPLDVTQFGEQLPLEEYVWTGTSDSGLPSGDHCDKWTAASFNKSGLVGQISPPPGQDAFMAWQDGGHWTDYKERPCVFNEMHLYCFED